MTITLNALQKQRRDTASNWTSNNPTLLDGELGYETDTKKFKIGDGSTAWQSLDYLPIPDTNRLLAGNLTVGGNFTVNGTTTTIDTTTLTVEDKNIEIGKVSSPSDTTADGGGITLKASSDRTITWSNANDSWDFNQNINAASTYAYKINNVSVLNATTLGSSVVNSSLTSVGTIATGVWNATAISGSKVTPDFGSQNIVTTGTITTGTIVGGGDLLIRPAAGNNSIIMQSNNGSETLFKATVNGSVELYHGTSTSEKKFETLATGWGVPNTIEWHSGQNSLDFYDGKKASFGGSRDLQIFHDSNNSKLVHDGQGGLYIGADTFCLQNSATNENYICMTNNGAVELYHGMGGSAAEKKLETTSNGAKISGTGATFLEINSTDGSVNPMVRMTNGDRTWDAGLRGDTSDSYVIRDHTASANRLTIDTSGRIGILNPNLDNFDSSADDLVINGSSNTGITINSGGTGNTYTGNLAFAEGNGSGGSADAFRGGISYKHGSDYMSFHTDNTERFRVDSSGRVQIGTTVGWGSNAKLHVSDTSSNCYVVISAADNGNSVVAFSDTAATERGSLDYDHDGDFLGIKTAGSERMRIDSSGNVEVQGGIIQFKQQGNSTNTSNGQVGGGNSSQANNSRIAFQTGSAVNNGFITFHTMSGGTDSERMRINSSGQLCVGDSSPFTSTTICNIERTNGSLLSLHHDGSDDNPATIIRHGRASGSDQANMIQFNNSTGSAVGGIKSTGSATAFNTSSDYRLKENVAAISDGITRLKTLKPSRFNFKVDKDTTVDGFLAHEVTAVPEAISGTKDAVDSDSNPVYQ